METLCSECGKTFAGVRALKKHVQEVHVQEVTPCSKCDRKFKSRKQMESHQTAHQTIICIGCNKQIPRNSKSTNHQQEIFVFEHQVPILGIVAQIPVEL